MDTNKDIVRVVKELIETSEIFFGCSAGTKKYKHYSNELYSLALELERLSFNENNYYIIKHDEISYAISSAISIIKNEYYYSDKWEKKLSKLLNFVKINMTD